MTSLAVHARDRIVLAWGLRRTLIALAAGAVSALAMPPFGAFPVLWLTLPVLVWLLDGAGAAGSPAAAVRSAAWVGWCFGFGYFLAGLWWIGAAFLVDAEAHAWLLPVAVAGLPAGLALFHAAGLALARLVWSPGPLRLAALASGLGLAELARGHVLTGFPWNSIGYALADNPWLGQAASIVGMEGLTPVAILVFAAPAALADGRGGWRPVLAAAAMLCLLAGFGGWRLAVHPPAFREDVTVRVLQPNVPQDEKFRGSAGPAILERYLTLSDVATGPDSAGMADADILVWPESAFPFLLERSPEALARIAEAVPEGTVLVTGAGRAEGSGPDREVFNSVLVLDGDAAVRGVYDKVRLVPFGEFLPFQRTLEAWGITQITRLPGGFAAGTAPRNLTLPGGITVAPLICYEAIFPHGVLGDLDARPDALLNVTNDGWFGDTPGPWQHLAQARLRAVEQGLPLIRAANTGVSAVIDPLGRTVGALPVGAASVIDARLPAALDATVFARAGWWIVALIYSSCLICALHGRRRV